MSSKPRATVRWIATALLWAGAGTALAACPICFQVEDTGVVSGIRAAVAVLGGVTSGVLVGVALFAHRLLRAERQ